MNIKFLQKLLNINDLRIIKKEVLQSNGLNIQRYNIGSNTHPDLDLEFLHTLNKAPFCKIIIQENGKHYTAVDISSNLSTKMFIKYLKNKSLTETQLSFIIHCQHQLVNTLRNNSNPNENELEIYKESIKVLKKYEHSPLVSLSKLLQEELILD